MPAWHWHPWDRLTRDDLYDALQLRQAIFVVEQECAYLDADGLDDRAWHLLGRDDQGRLLAYLRAFGPGELREEATIGRVIVAGSERGTGLGRVLMREGHRRLAAQFGPGPVHVGAQAHLERFYGSLGYAVSGPGYDEDGIPHLPMRAVEPLL